MGALPFPPRGKGMCFQSTAFWEGAFNGTAWKTFICFPAVGRPKEPESNFYAGNLTGKKLANCFGAELKESGCCVGISLHSGKGTQSPD